MMEYPVFWSTMTLFLYVGVIVSTYFILILRQPIYLGLGSQRDRCVRLDVTVVFGILLFLKGLGTTGRDLRTGYYLNFLSATSLTAFRDKTTEIGYRLLTVIIRNITDQYWVYILVVGLITLIPVFFVLWKYKDKIDYPVAFLMYTSIYYFSGFSPFRIVMAASIGLVAFDAIIEKKKCKALLWILLATSFHTTALILLIPYIVSMVKLNRGMMFAIGIALFAAVYFGRDVITKVLAGDDRYYIYTAFEEVDFGFEQLVYFGPLFLLYFATEGQSTDKRFNKFALIYLILGFCFGMFGYIFSIFGRFKDMFLPLIVIVPYYFRLLKQKYSRYSVFFEGMAIVYCLARFLIYIVQYYSMDDIMPYTNIFGWMI